jgi:thioredoxin-dependent peroxiredoxin
MLKSAPLLLPLLLLTLIACGGEPKSATTPSSSTPAADGQPSASKPTTSAETADALVGKTAPDFSSTAHDGFAVKMDSLKGKHVVLYFYPKDETPGCTKEACAFRDAWKDLESKGVVLVGISADSIDSHKQFAEHHKLPFHLVSDADGSIAQKYGVPNNNGFLGRQSFVIGPDGNVKKVYRKVDVTKHASEILDDVKS